jgi:ABC-type multidrug transport system ATPase subunit
MDEIDEFCDRIALIDHGRIAAVGCRLEVLLHLLQLASEVIE